MLPEAMVVYSSAAWADSSLPANSSASAPDALEPSLM